LKPGNVLARTEYLQATLQRAGLHEPHLTSEAQLDALMNQRQWCAAKLGRA